MSEDPKKQTTRDGRDSSLELLIGQLARSQPLRRAPGSLEHRVLAQLAQQQTTAPAWRKGFTHWPLAARAAFLIASVGFVWLTVTEFLTWMSFLGSGQITGTAMSWLHVSTEVASPLMSAGSFVLRAIPSEWLYAAAAAGFLLYAMLFGLGTVAYRTLYVER